MLSNLVPDDSACISIRRQRLQQLPKPAITCSLHPPRATVGYSAGQALLADETKESDLQRDLAALLGRPKPMVREARLTPVASDDWMIYDIILCDIL